jgi:hypothetical protein
VEQLAAEIQEVKKAMVTKEDKERIEYLRQVRIMNRKRV